MTETLTAPVADALADAAEVLAELRGIDREQAIADTLAVVDPAAVLADYQARYRVALRAHDVAVNVLRLHRRRGAYIARENETPGTTYLTRLADFGVTKQDGSPLTTDKAQHREANVFAVLATIRPTLWDVDTLTDGYDAQAFALWARVDEAARAGAAAPQGDKPSILANVARASLRAVSGKDGSAQDGGTLQYADPFADEAWPALAQEFAHRVERLIAAQSKVKDARKSNASTVDDAKRESAAEIEAVTGESAAQSHHRDDVSTSEGTTGDAHNVEAGSGEREPLSLDAVLIALEADLSTLTGGGSVLLPREDRERFYAVVRKFTASK